jgi:hypothetical protein
MLLYSRYCPARGTGKGPAARLIPLSHQDDRKCNASDGAAVVHQLGADMAAGDGTAAEGQFAGNICRWTAAWIRPLFSAAGTAR